MKKLLSDKAFLIELISFVVLQVFIDTYRVFFNSKYQILGLSLPELVNIAYLVFLSAVFFLKNLKKPKKYIPVAIYLFSVILYFVFHTLNLFKLDQNILTGSELDWFKEIYYILRNYLIPVLVFYYFLCSNLTISSFKKTVSALSLIISANIVLTNIFKVSFICYASALEKNTFITRNIFEWFFNPDTESPVYMTSKGWFYMGNQIGLILLMLFVFVVMNALESGKIRSYLLVFLNGIALIMIGTKVSAIGGCAVLAVGLILALIFGVWLKQFSFKPKHFAIYALIAVLVFFVNSYSPTFKVQENKNNAYTITEVQKEATDSFVEKFENQVVDENDHAEFIKEFSEYVNSSPYLFGVDPQYLELFPIEENFDFWFDIVIYGNNSQIDYRYLKSLIYEEVVKLNSNEIADRFWGIGYVSNFPYVERDFVSQNIWFGYIGTVLLIFPYIAVVAYGIFLALKNIKTCFVYQNAFFAMGICLPLLLSYLAGHLFYGIFSITIFALISAAFYKFQKERYPDR